MSAATNSARGRSAPITLTRAGAAAAGVSPFASPVAAPLAAPGPDAGEARGLIADVAQVMAWLVVARRGDRFVYATRPYLPVHSTTAERMRTLQERGLVHLARKRSDLFAGEFCYFAERTARPYVEDAPMAAPRSVTIPAVVSDAIDRLLPVLTRAARFARPCPTNRQLAARTGIAPSDMASAFDVLNQRGLIQIIPAKAPTLRQVHIIATGHRTGLVASDKRGRG